MKITISQLRKIIHEAIDQDFPEMSDEDVVKGIGDMHARDKISRENSSWLDNTGLGGPKRGSQAEKEITARTIQHSSFVKALRNGGFNDKEIEKAWLEACDDQGIVKSEPNTPNNPWD